MHTLQWNPSNKKWTVLFASETQTWQLGDFEKGQDAADLVSALNGGQPAVVTDAKPGWLGVTPGPSDEELMKQLQEEPAKAPA